MGVSFLEGEDPPFFLLPLLWRGRRLRGGGGNKKVGED